MGKVTPRITHEMLDEGAKHIRLARDGGCDETQDKALAAVIYAAMTAARPADDALANEVRDIAEDSNYSNEMVGIAVRNWFHRAAIAALKSRRTS